MGQVLFVLAGNVLADVPNSVRVISYSVESVMNWRAFAERLVLSKFMRPCSRAHSSATRFAIRACGSRCANRSEIDFEGVFAFRLRSLNRVCDFAMSPNGTRMSAMCSPASSGRWRIANSIDFSRCCPSSAYSDSVPSSVN